MTMESTQTFSLSKAMAITLTRAATLLSALTPVGVTMAELDEGKPVSLEELMLATLAQTDALTKLLIEKACHY